MHKGPTARDNIYGERSLCTGDTIYITDDKRFKGIACPMKEVWFVKFMRGSKLRMGVVKNK